MTWKERKKERLIKEKEKGNKRNHSLLKFLFHRNGQEKLENKELCKKD